MILRFLVRLAVQALSALVSMFYAIGELPMKWRVASKGDVRSVVQHMDANSGVFCVFHIYPVGALPPSTYRALRALSFRNVNIIAVVNGKLQATDAEALATFTHTVIIRENWGRDFGGYKTGVLHILGKHQPSRLLLLNDSMFYSSRGLAEFVDALLEPHAFSGASENHNHHYHVGSFALSFGAEVIGDPRFAQFWRSYQPTNLRPNVIRNGEMALTDLIVKRMRIAPHVIYSPVRLAGALAGLTGAELVEAATCMPQGYQSPVRLGTAAQMQSAGPAQAGMGWLDTFNNIATAAQVVDDEREAIASSQVRRVIEASLMDFVYRHSQIHLGAYLFVRLMDCPIIKKDLMLRGFFEIGDLRVFQRVLPDAEYTELFSALTQKGDPRRHWSLKRRILYYTNHL